MDVATTLASALGLGLLAGVRLYATVFAVGLLVHFNWIELPAHLRHASVLGDTRVIALAGAACLIEFIADKVPWLDSLWDSFHAFIRPIGAALAATSLFASLDPAWQLSLILLTGGVAFTAHSAKSATRLFVNHSPEPFSNIALSLAEDLVVAGGVYLWAKHPFLLAMIAAVFLAIFGWLAPRIYRAVRAEWTAFRSLVCFWSGKPTAAPQLTPGQQTRFDGRPPEATFAVICDAKGLRNTIGALALDRDTAVFFTRKWGRPVEHVVQPIRAVEAKRRVLLDSLILTTSMGDRLSFDLLAGQFERARSAAAAYGRPVR